MGSSGWFSVSSKLQRIIGYTLAPVLGLLVFHLLFDAPVFLNLFWGLDVPNDFTQHVSGFYALRSAPLGLPLLHTSLLGYPEGVSVFFTDSIPIFALLFKLLAPLFPADFHYFKLWVLLAFLLQPVAAVYLIRTLGYRQAAAAFFAAAFSLLIKWLIFRVAHPALTGQFLILIAFAFYIQQTRAVHDNANMKLLVIKWLGLISLSFLIHLYLFAMVVGIFFAAVLDFRVPSGYTLPVLFYKLNLQILPILLFSILYAVFVGANSYMDLPIVDGFGCFSLNIAGPVFGGNLISLPDKFGPNSCQIFEDQSYLGLGLVLMFCLGLFLERRNLWAAVKRHFFLILLFLGFYLFSLSTDIYLGGERIYRYPEGLTRWIQTSPFSQFRASARFFWPVGYGMLFFSLTALLKKRWALPVLACLLLVQWVDLPKPYTPRPAGYANAFNADLPYWDALLQGKKSLYLYPTLFCGGNASRFNIPILLMASKNGVTSNSVFVTRYEEDCDEKTSAGLADISAGTVHIFAVSEDRQTQQALQSFNPDWCASRAEFTLCIPDPGDTDRYLLQRVDELILNTTSPLKFP